MPEQRTARPWGVDALPESLSSNRPFITITNNDASPQAAEVTMIGDE
jgi:hypothetical protein